MIDYDEDPELGDEEDPEYRNEQFEMYLEMGWTPSKLKDKEDQEEYAAWLRKRDEK